MLDLAFSFAYLIYQRPDICNQPSERRPNQLEHCHQWIVHHRRDCCTNMPSHQQTLNNQNQPDSLVFQEEGGVDFMGNGIVTAFDESTSSTKNFKQDSKRLRHLSLHSFIKRLGEAVPGLIKNWRKVDKDGDRSERKRYRMPSNKRSDVHSWELSCSSHLIRDDGSSAWVCFWPWESHTHSIWLQHSCDGKLFRAGHPREKRNTSLSGLRSHQLRTGVSDRPGRARSREAGAWQIE